MRRRRNSKRPISNTGVRGSKRRRDGLCLGGRAWLRVGGSQGLARNWSTRWSTTGVASRDARWWRSASSCGLVTPGNAQRSISPPLQAGGHRFDPGTLHGSTKPLGPLELRARDAVRALLVTFGATDVARRRVRECPRPAHGSCRWSASSEPATRTAKGRSRTDAGRGSSRCCRKHRLLGP